MLFIFVILFISFIVNSYSYNINILVKDSENMSFIDMATVILKDNNNINIEAENIGNGSYLFKDISSGKYFLIVYCLGYIIETNEIELKNNYYSIIYLYPDLNFQFKEIEIIGNKYNNISSKINFSKNELKTSLKGIMNDPIEPIKNITGILSDPLIDFGTGYRLNGVSRLKVRGGNYYENSAIVDGAIVEYPYHIIYPDSIFIDDMIESVSLYRGIPPVRYGESLSSFLDIKLLEPIKGFHGIIKNGLLSSSLVLSGSSFDENLKFTAGIRRIHLDFIQDFFIVLNRIFNFSESMPKESMSVKVPFYLDSLGNLYYKYNDKIFKFNWIYSLEPSLNIYINSNNNYIFNEHYETNNYYRFIHTLSYTQNFFKNLFFEQYITFAINRIDCLSYSIYYSYSTYDYNDYFIQEENSLDDYLNSKTVLKYSIDKFNNLESGFDIFYYPDISYKRKYYYITNFISSNTFVTNYALNNEYKKSLFISSFFSEYSLSIFSNILQINPGLRINWYDLINKWGLEGRLNISYFPFKEFKTYISIGNINQFPSKIDILEWLEINNNTDIPGALHYILGLNLKFLNIYDMNLELYFKDYYNNLTGYYINSNLVIRTTGSDKQVYGLDFILTMRKDKLPLYGWLSFSTYQTWGYRDDNLGDASGYGRGGNPGIIIAGQDISVSMAGNIYMPAINPPVKQWYLQEKLDYRLNITLSWDIFKNFKTTFDWNLISGKYYTPVIGVTNYVAIYGEYNSKKFKDHHYLNIKLDWDFNLYGYHSGLSLQLYNIYNNVPIIAYSYSTKGQIIEEHKYFIGFYPAITFWLEW